MTRSGSWMREVCDDLVYDTDAYILEVNLITDCSIIYSMHNAVLRC
jgi:hypothetical protein